MARGRPLFWLVFVALSVRLLHVAASLERPFVASPVYDAATHLDWARGIAAGVDPMAGSVYWKPPLYPYFVAGLFRLFGDRPVVVLLVQAAGGASTAALVALSGLRLIGAPWGWVAGWIVALWGPLLYFETEYLAASVATGLVAAGLAGAALPGLGAAALSGLAFGLAGTAFPFALAGWPAAVVGRLARREGAAAAAVLVAGSIPLGIVAARNVREGGACTIAANGPVNLYLGNAPDDRRAAFRPGVRWKAVLELAGPPDGWRRRPGVYLRAAAAEIAADPGAFARGLVRKALQVQHGHERMRNTDPYEARRHSLILRVLLFDKGIAFPFGVVGPLALLGLSSLARRPGGGVAVAHIAGVFLLSVVFFVTARYRLAALPALALAAAAGLRALSSARGHKRFLLVASLAALVALAAAPVPGLRLNDAWTAAYDEGHAALGRGDLRAAEALFALAATLAPADAPEPLAERAGVLDALGWTAEAIDLYRAALDRFDGAADLWLRYGEALARAGRSSEARAAWEEALRRAPGHPRAAAALRTTAPPF